VRIRKENYPKTIKAMQLIVMDNSGLSRDTPILPEEFEVPDFYGRQIPDIERGLVKLNDEELDIFCTGEFEESRRITERHIELYIANTFLEDFHQSEWPGRFGIAQPETENVEKAS
jgi:hypothetical protein